MWKLVDPALGLVLLHGEAVVPARGDAGSGFAAKDGLSGVLVHEFLIKVRLVVEAVYVQGGGIGLEGRPGVVVAGGGGPGGVLAVADVGEHLGNVPAGAVPLLAALVADAPENHRGVVAVPVDEGDEVFCGRTGPGIPGRAGCGCSGWRCSPFSLTS